MDMEERRQETNWFDAFAALMDQNIRGVEYGVYCVAGLGFLIAMKSVKPMKKFAVPSDIPKQFIKKRMTFNGKVLGVQQGAKIGDNPILLIDHYPIIKVPFFHKSAGLPLQVSGVNVSSHGVLWMHNMLVGADVRFTPLRTDDKVVHGFVEKQNQNVGHHLVSIGFGTVSGFDLALEKDPAYRKHYKRLLGAEQRAEWSGAGVWLDRRPSFLRGLYGRVRGLASFSLT